MTNEERKFWYRMEDAVIASGMSKSEIARQGGFHRQTITYTGNANLPTCRVLMAFCKVTGTSADWLLGLDGKHETHNGK